MTNKALESIKKRFHKILGYGTWVFIVILLVSTVKNINRVVNIRKQVEIEKAKVAKMQADNVKLQAQIAETEGAAFIDKQIRNKLGLTKEGEAVVILPEESIVKSFAPPVSFADETAPDPNWKKWEKLFF